MSDERKPDKPEEDDDGIERGKPVKPADTGGGSGNPPPPPPRP